MAASNKRLEVTATVTLNRQAQRKTVTLALPKGHEFTEIFFEVHTEFSNADLGGGSAMVLTTENNEVFITQNEEIIALG
jgi:hypothetical protein